jgi:hypothetical protein
MVIDVGLEAILDGLGGGRWPEAWPLFRSIVNSNKNIINFNNSTLFSWSFSLIYKYQKYFTIAIIEPTTPRLPIVLYQLLK